MKKTKLFIQIPCLNEEKTLPLVIAGLPRLIQGVDEIYTLVIDDGSTDRTYDIAKSLGVDFILRNERTIGLAGCFSQGLEACLYLGADIIVNTDGDNQYDGRDIERLVGTVIERNADIVIGCRNIDGQKHFSPMKRMLQKFGSSVVRRFSKTEVADATSGFRALNRNSAIRFSFTSKFSYTIEMLIQAGLSGMRVASVPVRTNRKERESRLFKSNSDYIYKQMKTLLGVYLFYRPIQFFGFLAGGFFAASAFLSARIFYYLYIADPELHKFKEGSGTLLLFTAIGTLFFVTAGLLGSVLSGLRLLLSDIRARQRSDELQENETPPGLVIVKSPVFFEWAKDDGNVPVV